MTTAPGPTPVASGPQPEADTPPPTTEEMDTQPAPIRKAPSRLGERVFRTLATLAGATIVALIVLIAIFLLVLCPLYIPIGVSVVHAIHTWRSPVLAPRDRQPRRCELATESD